MKCTADRLPGSDFRRSVLAAGRYTIACASEATVRSGAARGGLEDSLYIGKGKLASSNAEQVSKVRRILEELGHEIATPTEARQILGLKGGDRVGF